MVGTEKQPRGFAAMTPEQRRALAQRGGLRAQAKGCAHRFTSAEAATAGRIGGLSISSDRSRMVMLGQRRALSQGLCLRGPRQPKPPRPASLRVRDITPENLRQFIEEVPGKLQTPCWNWVGDRTRKLGDYPVVGGQLVHRIVCEMFHGPLGDKWSLHRCDNPKCVNPEHLYPGTPADNVADRYTHGRGYVHPMSDETRTEVRRQHAAGVSRSELAKRYGYSVQTIGRVCRTAQRKETDCA